MKRNRESKDPDSAPKRVATDHSVAVLPFNGAPLGFYGHAERYLSDWAAPAEGINIQGGAVYLHLPFMEGRQRVFAKRMACEPVFNAVAADRIRHHFFSGWCDSVGTHSARFAFDAPFVIPRRNGAGRGDITIKTKSPAKGDWFLLADYQHRAVTLREYVRMVYQIDSTKLDLPSVEQDGRFLKRFTKAFALRMVLGVTDPGPGNFLVENPAYLEDDALPRIFSVDEGSAFSMKLSPWSSPYKPWLRANLAGPRALAKLAHPSIVKFVAKLQQNWAKDESFDSVCATQLRLIGLSEEHGKIRGQYVRRNIASLLEDWKILVKP